MKKFLKKIGKAIKKAGPAALVAGPLAGKLAGAAGAAGPAAATMGLGKLLKRSFKKRRPANPMANSTGGINPDAPAVTPEDNRAGMAGTAMPLKRGGAVRKDMKGRAMKKTGADAMGRAMAKKPAAKKPAAKKKSGRSC